MKKVLKNTLGILAIIGGISFSQIAYSQPPPPPGGASGGGSGTGGTSGQRNGAPIGGGLFILLGLAAAYGGKKLYDMREENPDSCREEE